MDTELAIMRILHIVPGAVWVGSAVFVAFILNPRLRALGPEVERPVTAAVSRAIGLIVTGAAACGLPQREALGAFKSAVGEIARKQRQA